LTGSPGIGRSYCRWAALQFAPAILVDGCWLAGISGPAEALDECRRHLLNIYADELGSGNTQWNHPNVYRRLLEQLEIRLPELDSPDFAGDRRFLNAAFTLPNYLLAMGWSGDRYFPELLGLNLAIELSGLGAGYLQTIDLLRYHGLDPTIVQLHLSIDNLASGHAAKACACIRLTLVETRRLGGEAAVQAVWRRIWTGYQSLKVATFGLAARLVIGHIRTRFGFPVSASADPESTSIRNPT
jgi:hypothetical protein